MDQDTDTGFFSFNSDLGSGFLCPDLKKFTVEKSLFLCRKILYISFKTSMNRLQAPVEASNLP
jgi:hypothetical protein